MAQKRVQLEQADNLFGAINSEGKRFDRFLGNVIFKQNETTIYCDSAHFFRAENLVEAYGRVKILEGDSITITASRLTYDGDTRVAKLRQRVVFTKLAQGTLYTDFLDYDRVKQEAYYFNNGKLVDSANVLTSVKGYYHTPSGMASFKKNVVGTNPDYVMKSDTMQYNTTTKIVFFQAPTIVTDVEGNEFVYSDGTYNTSQKRSDLSQGEAESENYILKGDIMFLDDFNRYYRATRNVIMVGKYDSLIIYGDQGEFWKDKGITKIYGNALLKKFENGDTLFLSADTLVSIDSTDPQKKRLLAYPDVKIFRDDLQGRADSMAYFLNDSIIHLYQKPVLWNDGSQMTADSINIEIINNTVDKINQIINAFVISKDSLKNYNQVKGRKMETRFRESAIHRVFVTGNGESLYFALDDKDTTLVGMNKILCSNMIIRFTEGQLDNMSFLVQPDALFVPPHEIKESERRLKDFVWRESERPFKEDLVRLPMHKVVPAFFVKTKIPADLPDPVMEQLEDPLILGDSLELQGEVPLEPKGAYEPIKVERQILLDQKPPVVDMDAAEPLKKSNKKTRKKKNNQP